MLSLNNLKASEWSRKSKKRLWRWNSSWKWTFCWKWCKWQNARWSKMWAWFEWGQTPLFRRTPKLRGFSNHIFKTNYNILNLWDLEALAQKWISEIDKKVLLENWVIRKKDLKVKLLWHGELKSKLSIKLDKASKKAQETIEKLWGTIEIIENKEEKISK